MIDTPAKPRTFSVPEDDGPRSAYLISSVSVTRTGGGAHDSVAVWSRGRHAGVLVVAAGDGAAMAALLGLPEVRQ